MAVHVIIFMQFTCGKNIENRIYMQTLSVRLFIHAEIRTKGNTNIKYSLIRICDTDKSSTACLSDKKYYYFHGLHQCVNSGKLQT